MLSRQDTPGREPQRSKAIVGSQTAEQVLVYLRISEDRTGEEAGVDRQREDCLALCRRLEVEVSEDDVYMDNDISAYLKKKRPDFERLLERVKLGPARIVVWHVDRLYRRPRELEDLIDLVESHPIRIEAVMGGAFDLNTHEGRLMARQLVAIASYESGHKADRIRRANQAKAERGDWHGAPKLGYGLGGVLIPAEARIVREMADRFLAGQSLRAITKWLNEESGMPSPRAHTGKTLGVWSPTTVKSILVSARISGQRAYEPGLQKERPTGREILGPGNWEAIITPEETARIRAIFANPDRRVGATSRTLLSSIATCGKCGAGLVSGATCWDTSSGRKTPKLSYRCAAVPGRPERGGLSVSRLGLDQLVAHVVVDRLADTTVLPDTGAPGVGQAMRRIVAARQRQEDLARDYGAGLLTRAEFHAGRTAAQNAAHDAELELGKVNRSSALKGLPIGDRDALRLSWDQEWSIPQKRAILVAVIDRLVVNPDPYSGSRFRPDRVELVLRA
ncbi:recombinase family protein [Microbacterium lacticum]